MVNKDVDMVNCFGYHQLHLFEVDRSISDLSLLLYHIKERFWIRMAHLEKYLFFRDHILMKRFKMQ